MVEDIFNKAFKIKLFIIISLLGLMLVVYGSYYIIISFDFELHQIFHFIIAYGILFIIVNYFLYRLFDYFTRDIQHFVDTGENIRKAYANALRFPIEFTLVSAGLYYLFILLIMLYMNVFTSMSKWGIFNIFTGGFLLINPLLGFIYYLTAEFFKPLVRAIFKKSNIYSLTELEKAKKTSVRTKIMITFIIISTNALVSIGTFLRYMLFNLNLESGIEEQFFAKGLIIVVTNLIISIFFGYLIGNNITFSLRHINENLKNIAFSAGDLNKKVIIITNGETARMSYWFNLFLEHMRELVLQVKTVSEKITEISELISATYEEITASLEEISSVIDSVSNGAVNQRESIKRMTKLSNMIKSDVSEIKKLSEGTKQEVEAIANAALDVKEKSENNIQDLVELTDQTRKTISSMHNLRENIEQIGTIAEAIKNISVQTNLLALNAAIESARAGERGEGFGVIAEEIRELNDDTNKAARNISDLITEIQDSTNRGIDQIKTVAEQVDESRQSSESFNEKLTQIASDIRESEKIINEISVRSNSQMNNLDFMVNSIQETSQISEVNVESTEEVAEKSEQQVNVVEDMANSAQVLSEYALQLKNLINRFRV